MTPLTGFRALGSRGLAASAAALGATALTIGLMVAPASASSTYVTTVQWNDYQTGLCLASDYSAYVYTYPCDGISAQNWEFWDAGIGANFQNQQTGLCLDGNYAGSVYTSPCDSDDTFQAWNGGGEGPASTIQNYQTGLCLDSNYQGAVYADACNWNDTYQNWYSSGSGQ